MFSRRYPGTNIVSSNSTCTADQLAEIAHEVWDVATFRVFPLVLESMLFAFYTALMIFYCLRFYGKRGAQRVWFIFAISVILYILSTVTWTLDISTLWSDMYCFLPDRLSSRNSKVSPDEALARLNGITKIAHDTCEVIVVLLSDIVSLWRAYIIYGKPRWLKTMSIAVVIVSTALYIVNEVMIYDIFSSQPYQDAHGERLVVAIQVVTLSATACAQLFATMLIAHKAWTHRKQLRELLPTRQGSYRHQRPLAVLCIIIETGIAYTCLRVFFVLANFGTHSVRLLGEAAYNWSNAFMSQMSGMYPTLVVLVVFVRESFIERSIQNASEIGSISGIRSAATPNANGAEPQSFAQVEGS
ncbi:unnamed protein product [Peniophora sp. CBMAI 1063]|nr:unnamed protein product [Peniophora sp. CBMAI 1063]